jgi:hypothetical protein
MGPPRSHSRSLLDSKKKMTALSSRLLVLLLLLLLSPPPSTPTGAPPFLSVILAVRNDDYGLMFMDRVKVFLNTLCGSFHSEGVDAEVILVEWNPPSFSRPIRHELAWPEWCPVDFRVLTVPKEHHDPIDNSQVIKLFEYHAKNAGLRIARGKWVLIINPDIVMSRSLVRDLLGKGKLPSGVFFRGDRYDFQGHVTEDMDADEVERVARGSVHYIASVAGGKQPRIRGTVCDRVAKFLGVPELKVGETKLESKRVAGRSLGKADVALAGPVNQFTPELRSKTCYYTLPPLTSRLEHNAGSLAFFEEVDVDGRGGSVPEAYDLAGCHEAHVVAAGDWTLIERSELIAMHGYPEQPFIGNADPMQVIVAASRGLKQAVIRPPHRLFHIHHDRTEQKTRPQAHLAQHRARSLDALCTGWWRQSPVPPVCNEGDQWGLGQEAVQEIVRKGGLWEKMQRENRAALPKRPAKRQSRDWRDDL